jgi:hypothetical protein
MFLSKLYRQMYAGTGISTDSARRKKSKAWARFTARQCKKLFPREAHAGTRLALMAAGVDAKHHCAIIAWH